MGAAVIRLWGIGFGLFHADEPIVVNHALAYGTGDFHPHFFAIPPLVSYLLFFLYGIFFMAGKIFGFFSGLEAFQALFVHKPLIFYALGRLVFGALLGTATVAFLYFFAKKFFSRNVAALAALFLAVNFLHARDSHYLYVDILMTLTVWAVVYCAMKIYERGELRYFLWAGAWLGAAVATKYNAAIVAPTIAVATFLSKRPFRYLIAVAGLSGFVYFALNPFSILDLGFFLKTFMKQAAAESPVGAGHHFFYSLVGSGGWGLLILALWGVVRCGFQDFKKAFTLFLFPVLFFVSLAVFSQHHERYVLPMIPFVCLAAGIGAGEIFSKNKFVGSALIAVAVVFPLLKSIQADRLFTEPDTTEQMTRWVEKNIPAGEKIAFDHSFYRPALQRSANQWEVISSANPQAQLKNRLFQKHADPSRPDYQLFFLWDQPNTAFSSVQPVLAFDIPELKERGIHYVTFHAGVNPEHEAFHEELKRQGKLMWRATPYRDDGKIRSEDRFSLTCAAYSWRELFSRKSFGPVMEIYAL